MRRAQWGQMYQMKRTYGQICSWEVYTKWNPDPDLCPNAGVECTHSIRPPMHPQRIVNNPPSHSRDHHHGDWRTNRPSGAPAYVRPYHPRKSCVLSHRLTLPSTSCCDERTKIAQEEGQDPPSPDSSLGACVSSRQSWSDIATTGVSGVEKTTGSGPAFPGSVRVDSPPEILEPGKCTETAKHEMSKSLTT